MDNTLQSSFTWMAYNAEFADKLLQFKNNRAELLTILKNVYEGLNMKYPFIDKGDPLDDICPFTVFGCFNKNLKMEHRIMLVSALSSRLGIQATVPTDFDGIPILHPLKAWFFGSKDNRQPNDISNLWDMFEAGLIYADSPSELTKQDFINGYDKVSKQYGINWNLTMGLFWIRPNSYLNLDGTNRNYLLHNEPFSTGISGLSDLKQLPDANTYLQLINKCKDIFEHDSGNIHSFPNLSNSAWKSTLEPGGDPPIKRYWMYAPGDKSSKWDEFYSQGIMGIEWDEMGDLKQYPNKDAMKVKMKQLYGEEYSYMNSAHATWQFANELHPGDIVYAKKGKYLLVGRGIVTSEYLYDNERSEYKSIHKIKWTDKGEWDHPGNAVVKTLTDITPYTDYVQKLEALFPPTDSPPEETEPHYEPYTKVEFLDEVFMDSDNYEILKDLLKRKQNLILQGPPGVGKTFAAKRLAYSIMGERDTCRVMMVQFHQSYSYEDFIMGFRPTENGFVLTPGPFYQFCKNAQEDDERDYYFIIDEINRGNLSKIFGELLMLIEIDKRGEKLRLLYSNELFSVPKKMHIIGMMNTADRSLAMIDYALRRRFAFFDIEPAFDTEGFKKMMIIADNPKYDILVERIKELNAAIASDESLGEGFRIGHSYLCTEIAVTNEWVASVVKYELVPLLKEYWFDELDKLKLWTNKLYGALND